MGDSLTVLTSGGEAMASDEVFALMGRLTSVSSSLSDSAWSIRHYGEAVPSVSSAASALDKASASCGELASTLGRLAEEVASQEWCRENVVRRTADTLSHYAVMAAAMTSRQSAHHPGPSVSEGGEPLAVMDDAAAVLLGSDPTGAVVIDQVGLPVATGPAMSMAERISRIPDTSTPIRIERYDLPDGLTHTEVYIAGTNEWSVGTGDSAFDLESNVALVGGLSAASVVATTQAMRAAGVKPGDRVSFIGHSQGGAVALTLAESGTYSTASLVTVGAPTGSLPVRGDYPALVIEHTGDIVPKLGGFRVPTEATVVQRDSGHFPLDVGGTHAKDGYRDTARRIDQSPMTSLTEGFTHLAPDTPGQVMVFRASRPSGPLPPE